MQIKFVLILNTLIILLSGCVEQPNTPVDFRVFQEIITKEYKKVDNSTSYEIGQIESVNVGQEMINKYKYSKYIKEKVDVNNVIYTSKINYKNLVDGNIYKISGYSNSNKEHFYIKIFEDKGYYRFLKINSNGSLVDKNLYDWSGNIVALNYIELSDINIFKKDVYEKEKEIEEKYLIGSFGFSLIYNGKNDNNIKIQYREFKDDMARTPFYQDLSYNLKESNIIFFKTLKIKIIEATNQNIKFIVLEE